MPRTSDGGKEMNDKTRYGAVSLGFVVTTDCLGSVDADEVRTESCETTEKTHHRPNKISRQTQEINSRLTV